MGDMVKKVSIIMPHMIHLTTHRLVSIFHTATGARNMDGIADIVYKILESRGIKPWELEKEYYRWHKRNWLYKTLLPFLMPKFMKDNNVLSPEAIKLVAKQAKE